MEVLIRQFTEDDYAAMVAVFNAVYPEYRDAEASWRHRDAKKEARIDWGRFVAEVDGRIAGLATWDQFSCAYHPRKFMVEVMVHPDHRRRGIGGALYERLMAELASRDPMLLRAEVNEANAVGVRFAAARGYVENHRQRESLLEFADFDPGRFAADLARVAAQGIVIRSLPELQRTVPAWKRRYHELDQHVAADVPWPDPHTLVPFAAWCGKELESPNFVPELHMIALDGERWVGLSNLWKTGSAGRLNTGLTGVVRDHRKRGIATALKVRAAEAAKALGYERTMTWNEQGNAGMLGINERLGFRFRPAWLEIERVLDATALAAASAEMASGGEREGRP
ncbi:MAG: GNAT family N-acetyltransferase [Candidatus Krumholzibacteriota bacterium]|nr:GNAT family N-acetyltransferase [Candidatus Krumholzibacteriota bacterium]